MTKWDKFFMNVAENAASMSKDPSTKVGACIVKDRTIIGVGFNGAPRVMDDSAVPMTKSEDLIKNKNTYMVHAEVNAILNSNIKECKDAEIYVTVSPCYNCALVISQAGIKKVYYKTLYHDTECVRAAMRIFELCGVEVEQI